MIKNQNLNKWDKGKTEPNIINFSRNWNKKLYNTFFTTIRKASTQAYYSQRIQEVFDVHLNKELKCRARLLSAELMKLEDITPELLVLDTGTTDWKELFKRFHVVDNCTLLLFVRIE
jgi:hypothetical protein